MIGVSASALQRIELGSLRLSDRLSRRIATITDVDQASLRTGAVPHIRHRSGEVYSVEHFKQAQQRRKSESTEHEREYMTQELKRRLVVLLESAPRQSVELIVDDLWDALDEIRHNHGLVHKSEKKLQDSKGDRRNKWHDIAADGHIVWFHDPGVRVVSLQTTIQEVLKQLTIGQNSMAFGRSNGGVLWSISPKRP